MFYAFIQNDCIFITDDLKNVPKDTIYKSVLTNDPNDYIIQNNEIIKKSDEQKLEQKKQEAIILANKKLKNLLIETDWAVVKCMELGLSIIQEYPEIAQQRNVFRQEIENKKERIRNVKNLQELDVLLKELK